MNRIVLSRLFKQSAMWLSLAAVIFTVFFVTSSGVASAHALGTPPAPCKFVRNVNYSESCVTPTITTAPQSQCPGTQYSSTTDSYHEPVNYTLTDQGNTCVFVTYNFHESFSSCDIYFYIPAGSIATAKFNYGGSQSGTIDENNSLAGWKDLYNSSTATTLTFTDHVPSNYPGGANLSWGSSAAYSLEVFCS
jgi:hypothetical protein